MPSKAKGEAIELVPLIEGGGRDTPVLPERDALCPASPLDRGQPDGSEAGALEDEGLLPWPGGRHVEVSREG